MDIDDKNLRGEVLASTYLAREPWFTVRKECVQMPNGEIIKDYYVHEHPEWVNVIAVTDDKKIVMIRQYRHALGQTSFEIPAGVCESDGSSPEENAKRELLEETGYVAEKWQHFMQLSSNPATHTNLTHTFLAFGAKPAKKQELDRTECIEVHLMSFEEVFEKLKNNEIIQSLMAAPLWRFFYEMQN